jgi:hypothetical protein
LPSDSSKKVKKTLLYTFFGVPHLVVFFLFSNEVELGARIDSGMALTPFSSSISDETRFEPTTVEQQSLLLKPLDQTDLNSNLT